MRTVDLCMKTQVNESKNVQMMASHKGLEMSSGFTEESARLG